MKSKLDLLDTIQTNLSSLLVGRNLYPSARHTKALKILEVEIIEQYEETVLCVHLEGGVDRTYSLYADLYLEPLDEQTKS